MRRMRKTGLAAACVLLPAVLGCKSSPAQYKSGEAERDTPARAAPAQGRVLKHRIAVLPFRDASGRRELADAATDILVTELFQSGRFVVIERDRLKEVLQEQELEGVVTPETLAKAGQALGAELFFTGSITNFELDQKHSSFNTPSGVPYGPGGIPSVPIDSDKSHVAVTLDGRIMDTTSARIIFAENASSSRDEKKVSIGGSYRQKEEMYGRLVRFAVSDLVHKMVAQMQTQPWIGRIAHINEQGIFISGGQEVNMRAGDKFQVIRRGQPIYDPGTGELIGYEEQPIGSLEVTTVQEKLSIARAVDGNGFEIGDVLRSGPAAAAVASGAGGHAPAAKPAAAKPSPAAGAAPAASAKRFCSSCGKELPANAKFCGACGAQVN